MRLLEVVCTQGEWGRAERGPGEMEQVLSTYVSDVCRKGYGV